MILIFEEIVNDSWRLEFDRKFGENNDEGIFKAVSWFVMDAIKS
jgi:hypothetical protein